MKNITCYCLLTLIILFSNPSVCTEAYFSTCQESVGRECPASDNQTQYLMSIKKGGVQILSTAIYKDDFYLCEEYNYDCGYLPEDSSYITIANGCQLNMDQGELMAVTKAQFTLQDKIKPYLGLSGGDAKCGMRIFPLTLTPAESQYFLDETMSNLETQLITLYNADRDTLATKAWADININIRTAIIAKLQDSPELIQNSLLWSKTIINDFTQVSALLKENYNTTSKDIKQLHEAYLIDAVTVKCNKTQSITFLMDQSGSIGWTQFNKSLDFLELYINQTLDDFQLMSFQYFGTAFRVGVPFGSTYADLLYDAQNSGYASSSTFTAQAMIQSANLIKAQNYPNGLPKILVVMTDGNPSASSQPLVNGYKAAQAAGMIVIAAGIGGGVSLANLQTIAGGVKSNVIRIASYDDFPKLVDFISNYFCKQILTIKLDESIIFNEVRVPTSPSYFRVQKSETDQFYELDVVYEDDHRLHGQITEQSLIDPFPDQFTELQAEYYEIIPPARRMLKTQPTKLGNSVNSGNLPVLDKFMKIFFIYPSQQITYTVKKQLTSKMNATVSYVSVGGYDLRFNITLKICTTFNCSNQRITLRQLTKNNTVIIDPVDPITPVTPVDPNKPNQIIDQNGRTILTPQEQDLSIFIIIGSTLAGLALCCLLCIFGIRKMNKQEQEQKEQIQNILPPNKNVVPVDSQQKIKKKKSSKRSKYSKSSKKSSSSGSSHSGSKNSSNLS